MLKRRIRILNRREAEGPVWGLCFQGRVLRAERVFCMGGTTCVKNLN